MASNQITRETILQLYRGELDIWGLDFLNLPDIENVEKEFVRRSEAFYRDLPAEYQKEFAVINNMAPGISEKELENTFIRGFQMGMKLAVEALYSDDEEQ